MINPSDTIATEEELRTIYAQPAKPVREKAFPHLDKHSRRYLELSPFFCIGSSQPDGLGDVSPRGGEPGFVHALDDMHIAFPDRPGNNRLDTLLNILHRPAVGLLFFLPGVNEMLRINGNAFITTREDLMQRFLHDGKRPRTVVVIETCEVYFHCSKALRRSDLWNPDRRISKGDFPTLGQNSLDAQREACAAFVLSQKHEGWSVLPILYDDGGHSGGTLERPALQRLLADIADAKVDVVVVYKIDRLTRSLFDFAKIVEVFEARGVSFVSITQQFNTTTSIGRLTLNVLLSFAQFEREVAGERIRDKIAASKKKGMWMGGLPPLGYEVRDRKLVINKGEAQTVLNIYRRYVELRSVRALKAELDAAEIRSKRRTFADGTVYGGHKLSRGALYLMLQNRIYRGEITHKGDAYPGEHEAIVDQALWDKVQAVLAENRVDRTTGADAKYPSLLAGLAFDDSGERLTPTHAVKKGTRYRYYVSKSLITGAAKDHSQGRRIPAGNLESLVIDRLRAFLADEGAVLSAISDAEQNGARQKRLIVRGRQVSEELPTLAPDVVRSILTTLVNRVDIKAEHIEIRVYRQRLHVLLQAESIEPPFAPPATASHSGGILKLKVKARLQRVGREMKLVVHNAEDRTIADPGLLRIVARAHDFQERLMQDPDLTVPGIASQERLTIGYLSRLLRLPSLAPDIVTAIINGKHPPELSAKRLMRLALKLPTDWPEQRKLLGFEER